MPGTAVYLVVDCGAGAVAHAAGMRTGATSTRGRRAGPGSLTWSSFHPPVEVLRIIWRTGERVRPGIDATDEQEWVVQSLTLAGPRRALEFRACRTTHGVRWSGPATCVSCVRSVTADLRARASTMVSSCCGHRRPEPRDRRRRARPIPTRAPVRSRPDPSAPSARERSPTCWS